MEVCSVSDRAKRDGYWKETHHKVTDCVNGASASEKQEGVHVWKEAGSHLSLTVAKC